MGRSVHDVTREGYRLSFQVMSEDEKRATLPPAQEQQNSREDGREHLMLFVLSPEGRFVTDASVRVSVKSPEGDVREAPAAPMAGGYGIDVQLHPQASYEFRAEIQVQGQTIVETFSYTRP